MGTLSTGTGDPYGRTQVPAGRDSPRYIGIRFIAYLIIVSGAIEIAGGVMVVGSSIYLGSASSRIDSELRKQDAADKEVDKTEMQEISRLEDLRQKATEDTAEKLQDDLDTFRRKHEQNQERRNQARLRRVAEAESRKAAAQVEKGLAALGWLEGIGLVITGLITIGIGQVFSAFRDMAINSYLMVRG